MSLTIGRVALDCPYNITHDGDRLSFVVDVDGYLTGANADVAKVIRQQLLGLVRNDDEPVVPITWDDDPDWDGFYRIDSVQVIPTEMYLSSGYVRYFSVAVAATRVSGGYAEATHELYVLGVDATDLTITNILTQIGEDAVYEVAWPATHTRLISVGTTARTAGDGTTIKALQTAYVFGGTDEAGYEFAVPPGNHYDGSCSIEYSVGGAWYPLVGRQVPDGATLRLSSGVVRFSVADDGEFQVESFDGTAWQQKDYTVTYDSGSASIDDAPISAIVYHNSPDRAVVEFKAITSDDEVVTIVATVRRGFPVVELSLLMSTQEIWKVTRSTTEAGTALDDDNSDDYAVRATSNDANGDRYLIVAREPITVDTTNGGITSPTTSAPIPGVFLGQTAFTFGIGMEIDGTSATAPNTAEDLAGRFQGAVYVERRVVT